MRVLKKVVANKWLNETPEIVGDINCPYAEQKNSSTYYSPLLLPCCIFTANSQTFSQLVDFE